MSSSSKDQQDEDITMYHGQEQREKHFDDEVVATRVPRRGPPSAKNWLPEYQRPVTTPWRLGAERHVLDCNWRLEPQLLTAGAE
jgi:hypothetical protein